MKPEISVRCPRCYRENVVPADMAFEDAHCGNPNVTVKLATLIDGSEVCGTPLERRKQDRRGLIVAAGLRDFTSEDVQWLKKLRVTP